MGLEELFCDIDDFCPMLLPTWHRQLLIDGTRQRQWVSRLTLAQIIWCRGII